MRVCDKCRSRDEVAKMHVPSGIDQGDGELPLLASFSLKDLCIRCRRNLIAMVGHFLVEDPEYGRES